MTPTQERRFARVQDDARSSLTRRMMEREQNIISRIVLEYRSGTITSEKLFGAVAAISELRSIAIDAEHNLMQASDDALSITSNQRQS